MENKTLKFPEGFLWGTATSAYQIEGGNHNDWSEWERSKKRKEWLIKNKKKPEDYICGKACNSYNLYEKDLELAKSLNNNAIRLGIEWARIQTKHDTWNVAEIEHYRKVLLAARQRGLKTVVTLWHWTNPTWFVKEGGWENKRSREIFVKYVNLVISELGGLIDYWVILNEPMMFSFGAYVSRRHPPQKFSLVKVEKVIRNLTSAYNQSYDLIHKHFPNAQVGVTNMLNYIEPAHSWNPIGQVVAKILHYYWNVRIVKKTKKCDFLGMNYYFHDRIIWRPPFKKNLNKWVNDKGWEIYPEGIYHMIKFISKYGKPVMIMENGLADGSDKDRSAFIKEHLRYMHKAISEGVDVRGYFHWSLLDNFEWAWGWDPKFGLFAVDRKTFERTPRPSAAYYAEICKNNSLTI